MHRALGRHLWQSARIYDLTSSIYATDDLTFEHDEDQVLYQYIAGS
jgi:hypothetical protein